MKIAVVTRDIELSSFTHERISQRVEKLGHRLEREPSVRVTLASMRNRFTAHLQMVADGKDFLASATDRSNVLRAFDDAAARVDRQITRHHKKLQRRDAGVPALG